MADDKLDFKALIAIVADGQALNAEQARAAFDVMMSGDATPSQMGAFLMALRVRGETVDEITGGVMTMREKMTPIIAPPDAMDIVGTGGDGKGTVNISTATAIVVAGCGVPVAKHGNRAASSKTGTTDVQSALGINVDADFALLQTALDEYRTLGTPSFVAGCHYNLGLLEKASKRTSRAREHFQQAHDIAATVEAMNIVSDAEVALAELGPA